MRVSLLLAGFGFLCQAKAQAEAPRPISLSDLSRFEEVNDPQVSPDGKWIAYTVGSVDVPGDKRNTDIWMVSWDGKETVKLTHTMESESSPRWSPDGKYLSFLSSRPGAAKGNQVWLLDRRGGEAYQLTDLKQKISGVEWSPDGKRLLLTMRENEDPEPDPTKPASAQPPPKPIVLDRYHFKQDQEGYLNGKARGRIFLYEMATKKFEPLTTDTAYDEENAAWSPDGTKVAFVSNQDKDWDRTANTDVFVVDAKPNQKPRRLTTHPGRDGGRLSWSPDSKLIAYTQGSDPKYGAYNINRLAVVPAEGGTPRVLTEKLDRNVSTPQFTEDGRSLIALVSDDRSEYPARVALDGTLERILGGERVVMRQSRAAGHTAVLASSDTASPEIFALDGGTLRPLTKHNAALMSELKLAKTENVEFKSKDGTEIHGLLTRPLNALANTRFPLLLRIHGGPNGQDAHQFQFERQYFAANGYGVLQVNYRGSSGRGAKYQESIFADWGNKEVADLLAGVDHAIAIGAADPDRLGIGGWSYGGILTDYTIAQDTRFKAAISGAGSANQISMYGTDQYTFQYDNEIGAPWKNPQAWIAISYPFFKADRIKTPTLFMGGDKDFNVPITGGEQMYQALQSLNIPTQLVIYPGQFHSFTRPSFIKDRYERYLAWYDKYIKAASPALSAANPDGS